VKSEDKKKRDDAGSRQRGKFSLRTEQFYCSGSESEPKELENYFRCSICLEVVDDPMQCGRCQKWNCSSCIKRWNKKSNTCPNCHTGPYKAAESLSMFALNQLNDTLFKCDLCSEVIKYELMKGHILLG
jgi:hypothetical protein